MTSHISIHNIRRISAQAGGTTGAPLTIDLYGDGQLPHCVTLFTDDFALSEQLAGAINATFAKREEERRVTDARVENEREVYEMLAWEAANA